MEFLGENRYIYENALYLSDPFGNAGFESGVRTDRGGVYPYLLAFDEDLTTLYSSTRKNGYTMFPAGPSREYLNRGVFRLRERISPVRSMRWR